MKYVSYIIAATLLSATPAMSQKYQVDMDERYNGPCISSARITIEANGRSEILHTFHEEFSFSRETPMYVALNGTEVLVFTDGVEFSCSTGSDSDWGRQSAVVPSDGNKYVTIAGNCRIIPNILPSRLQIVFNTRFGSVLNTGNESRTRRQVTYDAENKSYIIEETTFDNYLVGDYERVGYSCLEVEVR